MGLTIDEIAVLELKSRWASCSDKKRKVNFHWKKVRITIQKVDENIGVQIDPVPL